MLRNAKYRARKMPQLTAKQKAFCQEYLLDFNGTQAAIRAGYAESGASVEGARLLSNAKVQAELARLMEARSERLQIRADAVVSEIATIAFQEVPAYNVKAGDKLKSLELLGKHLGLFRDLDQCLAGLQQYGTITKTEDGYVFRFGPN